MGTKSASNILHDILVQHPIGYEFDVRSLEEEAIYYGYNFSEGAITGFIARALRKEIISIKGTIRPKGTKHTRRVYTLMDKQDWEFKPAGVGSYPGREVHGKARGNDQLELLNQKEEATVFPDPFNETIKIPLDFTDNISEPEMDQFMSEIMPTELSLGEQLIAIAAKVELLENKPEKSLADYSTNDLIEELRKRIK